MKDSLGGEDSSSVAFLFRERSSDYFAIDKRFNPERILMDNISDTFVNFPYIYDCMSSSSPISDPSPVKFDLEFTDTSTNSYVELPRPIFSDEDIILASNRPKKRAGRKKFKETRHPIYRGIRKRNLDKWVCEIREPINQKRIWLGTYPTADMAARAHDVAALALKGHSATLNFADSTWRLTIPASKDPKEIGKAAMEGAEMFRPKKGMGLVQAQVEESELENLFDMKDWALNIADGPLFSPGPNIECGFSLDHLDEEMEVSLWNY